MPRQEKTFKALHMNKPNPIMSMRMEQAEDARVSRSETNGNLLEAEVYTLAKSTFLKDSIRVWNRAPNVIKNSKSIYSAKIEIKKFVKTLPV